MRATMRIPAWLVIGIIWAAGANADSLADATRSYRKNRDYASLQVISAHLRKGMPRREVEALLGSPDTEITEGSCVYGSDREVYVEEAERVLPVVLIVEFHDDTGKLSEQLQYWELTWIGE